MSDRKEFEKACDDYCTGVKNRVDYYEPRKRMRALFSRVIERAELAERRLVRLKAEIERIGDALGTGERGDNLVEVARNAHRAEQQLAAEAVRRGMEKR